jgi:hypothetical protein
LSLRRVGLGGDVNLLKLRRVGLLTCGILLTVFVINLLRLLLHLIVLLCIAWAIGSFSG